MTAIYIVNLKLPAFISIHIYLFPLCDVINNSHLSLYRHGEILLCNPATHFHYSISILDFAILFDQWSSQYGGKGGAECPLDREKFAKNQEKEGKSGEKREKIRKKEEKLGRKGKNWEGSFTLPLLTDKGGYATVFDAKYWPWCLHFLCSSCSVDIAQINHCKSNHGY